MPIGPVAVEDTRCIRDGCRWYNVSIKRLTSCAIDRAVDGVDAPSAIDINLIIPLSVYPPSEQALPALQPFDS